MAATVKTVLITGSSRGIGLALAAQYKKLGWNVIGTASDVVTADKLRALAPYKIVPMDTGDECSVVNAATMALRDDAIDLLIQSAQSTEGPEVPMASKAHLLQQFEEHTVAPLLVTHAFLPHLQAAAACRGTAMVTRVCLLDDATHENESYASGRKRETHDSFALHLSDLVSRMMFRSIPEDLQATIRVAEGSVLPRLATDGDETVATAAEKFIEGLKHPTFKNTNNV